jgi:hypothetical protein
MASNRFSSAAWPESAAGAFVAGLAAVADEFVGAVLDGGLVAAGGAAVGVVEVVCAGDAADDAGSSPAYAGNTPRATDRLRRATRRMTIFPYTGQ